MNLNFLVDPRFMRSHEKRSGALFLPGYLLFYPGQCIKVLIKEIEVNYPQSTNHFNELPGQITRPPDKSGNLKNTSAEAT